MKKMTIEWEVIVDKFHDFQYTDKKQMMDDIKTKLLGKKFEIIRMTINREIIRVIDKKRPRPCYGGWSQGHSTEFDWDKTREKTKFTWCSRCGYKLKLVERNFIQRFILVKPLIHKDDKK